MKKTDFLVIGSGLAGLSFALKAALKYPEKTVTIVTKSNAHESNTYYAQGGIAVVVDQIKDSFEKHIEDTLIAGDGLCDKEVVEIVVKEGPDRLKELTDFGVDFDRTASGDFHLGIEGAHSAHRILHHKDSTGLNMQATLLNRALELSNVTLLDFHFAIDLITQHHLGQEVKRTMPDIECFGAYIMDMNDQKVELYLSKVTIISSGGIGQVYSLTTNPAVATGDGVAMAYRAKANIANMQFVQFHPTALFYPAQEQVFLISEAVRGAGGILKTKDGQTFMEKYDERGSMASRDIVARAIDGELKARGENCVYLDCTHLDKEEFMSHFPKIYNKCKSIGIDIEKDMIPVAPAAHYLCGGVVADLSGRTNINRLYACGEAAHTGLHGANRLASNSLLEALVFAHRCFIDTQDLVDRVGYREDVPEWQAEGTTQPSEWVLINHNRKEVQDIMSGYVGIVRSNERLDRALARLEVVYKETDKLYKTTTISPQLCELRNLINVAYLIVKQSLGQRENRGTFFNIDLDLPDEA